MYSKAGWYFKDERELAVSISTGKGMMKIRKIRTGVLCVYLTLSILAGCHAVVPKNGGKITQEPLGLSILFVSQPGLLDDEDLALFEEAAKLTNISLHRAENTNTEQQYSIVLPSDYDADIVQGLCKDLNNGGKEGAYLPLDELIEQYAPNIKKLFEDNPALKMGSLASDGKLYTIPYMTQEAPIAGFYIRQDWLDKLGLPVPETAEQYYQTFKAFYKQDPNGNGVADEVPYFSREGSLDGLLQLWDAYTSWHIRNGKVVHGKTEPQYRAAIQSLSQWYAEGLIDRDIYTRGHAAGDQLVSGNLGGAAHDTFSSSVAYQILSSKIQEFRWVAIPPPADVNGVVKETEQRGALSGWGWAISKDNQHPVETIKYFDFWVSDVGKMLYSYGIEGVDYSLVDGKPVFTRAVLDSPSSARIHMWNRGQKEIGTELLLDAELQMMDQSVREGYELYLEGGYCEKVEAWPALYYTDEENRIIREKGAVIEAYISLQQQKWILGTEVLTDESWNSYLSRLEQLGLKEYTKVYQDAYNRYAELDK